MIHTLVLQRTQKNQFYNLPRNKAFQRADHPLYLGVPLVYSTTSTRMDVLPLLSRKNRTCLENDTHKVSFYRNRAPSNALLSDTLLFYIGASITRLYSVTSSRMHLLPLFIANSNACMANTFGTRSTISFSREGCAPNLNVGGRGSCTG